MLHDTKQVLLPAAAAGTTGRTFAPRIVFMRRNPARNLSALCFLNSGCNSLTIFGGQPGERAPLSNSFSSFLPSADSALQPSLPLPSPLAIFLRLCLLVRGAMIVHHRSQFYEPSQSIERRAAPPTRSEDFKTSTRAQNDAF